ncbi:MAG: hypothetical protein JST80_09800 [Bdellovibrionales bacterium]|nr:hypothetical protein [Bdellovibrionales bacterium]
MSNLTNIGSRSQRRRHSESGQAIIEYVILLTIILTITGLFVAAVRSSRDKMWKQMICDISAACPDCHSPQSAQDALPKSGVKCKN